MAISQNEALLVAVFRQLAVTKIDYGILGKDLGLSREAARNRWVRFQSMTSNSTAANDGQFATLEAIETPKRKGSVTKPKTGKTRRTKKRKRMESEDSDELAWDESMAVEKDVDGQTDSRVQIEGDIFLNEEVLAEEV
ncbi:hypothetical protein VTL71DRAFT_9845 [Oculimacula yallundae]|uniref:Myb-like DNA-binding domain-containing protein n=1 Tax=Oculimacula yallundae TaxID=86028 RepID=A0ABR4BTN3_9HELO